MKHLQCHFHFDFRAVLRLAGAATLASIAVALAADGLIADGRTTDGRTTGRVAAQSIAATETPVTWDQVKPILQKRCLACHRGEQARGGLDLSSVAGITAGSSSGAAVVSGKPEESMIYTLPAHLDNPRMPPNSPRLPQRELELLHGWIAGGLSQKTTTVSEDAAAPRPVRHRRTPALRLVPRPDGRKVKAGNPQARINADAAAPGSRIPTPRRSLPREVPEDPVTALAVSPSTPLMAVSGHHLVRLFRWADLTQVAEFPFPEGDIFALRFSRDGSLILAAGGTGGLSGRVVVFNSTTGERVFEAGTESDVILAADLSPDGRLVAFGGPDRKVHLADSAHGRVTAALTQHTDWVTSVAFSPDGLLLATGDRFGSLSVWEPASGNEFHQLKGHTGGITALVWSGNSDQLMSAGLDGTVRFWDMHQGTVLRQLDVDPQGVLSADLNPAGWIVCSGRSRKLRILQRAETTHEDSASDRNSIDVAPHEEVTRLSLTPDGNSIITGDMAGRLHRYDAQTGVLLSQLLSKTSPLKADRPHEPLESADTDWPGWRGPKGDGVSQETTAPLHWSPTENIAWRTEIPGRGRSSPIVFGSRVFVTTGIEEDLTRRVLCLDRRNGTLLWNTSVHTGPGGRMHLQNTTASSTPVTDGIQVYSVFVDDQDMQVVALNMAGEIQWNVRPGSFESRHGFAASPVLYDSGVIVNGQQDGNAFVVMLDRNSGKELWRYAPAVSLRSFATPVLTRYEGRDQLILAGSSQTVGLNPGTGELIWSVTGPSDKFVCTPAVGQGMVFSFAGSPHKKALAVRLGGRGDVTETHVVWRCERGMPYVPSPLLVGDWLHVIADNGVYSCIEPLTGNTVHTTRATGPTYCSPIAAGGNVYLFEDAGGCTIIENGPHFTVLAKNELGEEICGSPAISSGQLFVRTATAIVCVGGN